jgi:hypothetical protein
MEPSGTFGWGGRNLAKMDRLQDALEAAGVEFTNGDQPGVRLTKVAEAHSVEPANALKPTAAGKAADGKTAKATETKR